MPTIDHQKAISTPGCPGQPSSQGCLSTPKENTDLSGQAARHQANAPQNALPTSGELICSL